MGLFWVFLALDFFLGVEISWSESLADNGDSLLTDIAFVKEGIWSQLHSLYPPFWVALLQLLSRCQQTVETGIVS